MTERTFTSIDRLTVALDIEGSRRVVGTLAWMATERRAYFAFDAAFLADPLPIAPFTLKPAGGLIAGSRVFAGLHSVFNDSLPDGWGALLFDSHRRKQGYDPARATPLDRLAAVGDRGVGALCYQPASMVDPKAAELLDLDSLAADARAFEADQSVAALDQLVRGQGSSAGARPKMMIVVTPDQRYTLDHGAAVGEGHSRWLVKFRSRTDRKYIAREEYAYALMARAAGIRMADATLLQGTKDRHFAVRRFDRTTSGRLHIASAAALLDLDFRVPGSLDYDNLLKLVGLLTRDQREVHEMLRRMIFNVLACNGDDHAKNHSFQMTADGTWRLTPAYDLTFSPTDHALTLKGEGRAPGWPEIEAVARGASVKDIRPIYDEVAAAVANWRQFADQAGLPRAPTLEIARAHGPS